MRKPASEQAALAKSLLLPLTFFCYKNEPSYTSDDETDGNVTTNEVIIVMHNRHLQFTSNSVLRCALSIKKLCLIECSEATLISASSLFGLHGRRPTCFLRCIK